MQTEKKIIAQGVRIYALLWDVFAKLLTVERRPAAAKKVAALKIETGRDIDEADKLIRDLFVYDSRRPNAVAPRGFYPLLGLALSHRAMRDIFSPYSLNDTGTFAGHLFSFNGEIRRFVEEVRDKVKSAEDLEDEVTRIYHDIPDLPSFRPNRLRKYKKIANKESEYSDAFYVALKGPLGNARVTTCKYGQSHLCSVEVLRGEEEGLEFRLSSCADADSALEKGIAWYENLKPDVFSVERTLKECYENWPSLYQTRSSVINHLFFVIGNGYSWFDGAIVGTGVEDHLECVRRDEQRALRARELLAYLETEPTEEDRKWHIDRLKEIISEATPTIGPCSEKEGPISFYPVCQYSKISCVPDDVKDDWLRLAYEAALMLRDRSGAVANDLYGKMRNPTKEEIASQLENSKIGAKVVEDLKTRFGDRLLLMEAL